MHIKTKSKWLKKKVRNVETKNAADEGHPHQLSHSECLPTHAIQMTDGVNSTESDLSPVPLVLCAPITEQA